MSNFFLGIIALSVLTLTCGLIYIAMELKEALRILKEFVKNTETDLKPTLDELKQTMRGIRGVTDNLEETTENVRALAGSVNGVTDTVNRVNKIVSDAANFADSELRAVRAGLSAAANVILKNKFFKKKL